MAAYWVHIIFTIMSIIKLVGYFGKALDGLPVNIEFIWV